VQLLLDAHVFLWLNSMQILPIALPHIYQQQTLPYHHRDPFDRLLVAQAMKEEMTLISADGHMPSYDVELIW
jgi:PIN domain nuclease of toxin-antitoxin system